MKKIKLRWIFAVVYLLAVFFETFLTASAIAEPYRRGVEYPLLVIGLNIAVFWCYARVKRPLAGDFVCIVLCCVPLLLLVYFLAYFDGAAAIRRLANHGLHAEYLAQQVASIGVCLTLPLPAVQMVRMIVTAIRQKVCTKEVGVLLSDDAAQVNASVPQRRAMVAMVILFVAATAAGCFLAAPSGRPLAASTSCTYTYQYFIDEDKRNFRTDSVQLLPQDAELLGGIIGNKVFTPFGLWFDSYLYTKEYALVFANADGIVDTVFVSYRHDGQLFLRSAGVLCRLSEPERQVLYDTLQKYHGSPYVFNTRYGF